MYSGPCNCELTDQEYKNAERGRDTIEHGLAITSYPFIICPKCGQKTNAMWWLGHD